MTTLVIIGEMHFPYAEYLETRNPVDLHSLPMSPLTERLLHEWEELHSLDRDDYKSSEILTAQVRYASHLATDLPEFTIKLMFFDLDFHQWIGLVVKE